MDKLPEPLRRDDANPSQREFWPARGTAVLRRCAGVRGMEPSTEMISLRLPKSLLDDIKSTAKALDVPYQSLIKKWLMDRLAQ